MSDDKKFPFDFLQCVEVIGNGAFLRTQDNMFQQAFALHSASAQANGQYEYIGFTNPGVGISASAWAIKQILYDASGNVSAIKWANGGIAMNSMWDDRATYVYS